ncbi:RfaG Glycosyltransferase [Candidatus Methylopumilus planktonicus]|uniref:glycosyltransferase family 4 protein n=1 Tax=Candidatus Methylopumilus planktonicus TaxID=1581557 RepID=UPI003BEEE6B7
MTNIARNKRIAIIVTSVLMVRFFLLPHILSLSKKYDLTLILKNDHPEILKAMNLSVRVVEIPIERKISLFKDFIALLWLSFFLKKERFDLVHTITPKAGLLGMIASWIAGCPRRLHTFQGEVWVTKKGIYRTLLKRFDCLVAMLSTNINVVSETERDFLIKEGVISSEKSTVLANGSISGVNLNRFKFDKVVRENLRLQLGLKDTEIVFLYIGRLNKDKGISELFSAFNLLLEETGNVKLLVVGVDEDDYYVDSVLSKFPHLGDYIKSISYTSTPESYMSAADVLVLPSHREGFGMVIIESAAVGIPSIGSNIYGIQDAIVDSVTGLLFEARNIKSLGKSMKLLSQNSAMRLQMGENAYRRVAELFNQDNVVDEMVKYYDKLLSD